MKQMNLLRVGVLLVAALFVVGAFTTGGFAKYITGSTGHDEARVAMFGVELEVGGNSFADNYGPSAGSIFTGEYAVKSNAEIGGDVVAPGTSSEEAKASTTFGAKGVPEVAVAIDISMDNAKDVFLKAGSYPDYTTIIGYENGTPIYGNFTLGQDYYPVNYTLTQTGSAHKTVMEPVSGNLEMINSTVAAFSTTKYEALTDLNATFELTWAWEYGSLNETTANDRADTYLGMVATNESYAKKADGSAATKGTDYSTDIAYDLAVQVVQLD